MVVWNFTVWYLLGFGWSAVCPITRVVVPPRFQTGCSTQDPSSRLHFLVLSLLLVEVRSVRCLSYYSCSSFLRVSHWEFTINPRPKATLEVPDALSVLVLVIIPNATLGFGPK